MAAESIQTLDVSRLTAETLVMDNPVLVKHVRSRLRKQHVIPNIVILVIIAALSTWSCFKLNAVHEGYAFSIICVLQGAILFVGGTSQVASAVAQARETGILDFHRVSPLSALAVTLGFVLGAPIREWVAFVTLIPFSLACVAGGNPDAVGWLKCMAAMIVAALLYHTVGALVGATSKPRTAGGVAVVVVVLLFFVGSVFWRLTPTPAIAEAIGQAKDLPLTSKFFGLSFSQFNLGLMHQVPLLAFLLIATVRKIRQERAFVYAKPIAILFLAILAIYLLGDTHTWDYARVTFDGFEAVFVAYFMTVAGIMLTTAVTPSWGAFANGVRRARKANRVRPRPMEDMASNLAPVIAFAVIVLAAPVASSLLRHAPHHLLAPASLGGVVASATVLMFGCAQQAFELTLRRSAKGYFALLLFLAWVVPLLLAAVAGITQMGERVTMTLLSISPLAGIGITAVMLDPSIKAQAAPVVAVSVSVAWALLFLVISISAARKAEAEV
ncbi:MAG TPA: ABC transporter permease [Armatimonadota bacterium]|jgi:hypothetical protein